MIPHESERLKADNSGQCFHSGPTANNIFDDMAVN